MDSSNHGSRDADAFVEGCRSTVLLELRNSPRVQSACLVVSNPPEQFCSRYLGLYFQYGEIHGLGKIHNRSNPYSEIRTRLKCTERVDDYPQRSTTLEIQHQD